MGSLLLEFGCQCAAPLASPASSRRSSTTPAELIATIAALRRDTTSPYDFVVGLPVGVDPRRWATAGATWWLPELAPEQMLLDQVRGVIRDGPLAD
jgi:hypothetical protein